MHASDLPAAILSDRDSVLPLFLVVLSACPFENASSPIVHMSGSSFMTVLRASFSIARIGKAITRSCVAPHKVSTCLCFDTGDKNKVKIGAHVHVGDKAVINTVGNVDTGFSSEVSIDSWVVIEPGAVLTSCMIGNR